MAISQVRLFWAVVLAVLCQIGLAVPFNGQIRAVTANAIGDYVYQGWSVVLVIRNEPLADIIALATWNPVGAEPLRLSLPTLR